MMRYWLVVMVVVVIRTGYENADEIEAEKFLEQLEINDSDPKIKLENLMKKFRIQKNDEIHRKTFQKLFTMFHFGDTLENCKNYQKIYNNQDIISKKKKDIAVMMNDFDNFMGIFKKTFIPYETVQKVLLDHYFRKYMQNLAHKLLRERKEFIARETLTELGDDFMEEPFNLEL